MKFAQVLAVAVSLFAPAASAAVALPSEVDGVSVPSLAPMLERTTPGVVNISTKGTVEVQRNPMFNDPLFRRFFGVPTSPPSGRSTASAPVSSSTPTTASS